MFSSRTDWDFRSSPLFSLLQQKRSRGEEIIDLTESNPTKCGFVHQPHQLIDIESLQRSAQYDPDPRGLLSAREAIAQWYGRQQIEIDPAQIILTSSTSEAYFYIFRLLCNLGEDVAVPRPSYPLFEYLGRLMDVVCKHYDWKYDSEWHIDAHSAKELIESRIKAFVLVHPNNPTGSFVKKEEREYILSAAKIHHVPLVVDEVFHAFPIERDERRAPSFAGTKEVLTFTLNGLSKLVGLPQMKLAWIVVSGPGDGTVKALQRLDVIADTFLSVGTPVQHALSSLLNDHAGMTKQILNRVRSNFGLLSRFISSGSAATLLQCEGAWNAILRLPATKSDEEWAQELLEKHGVLSHPGHLFDLEMKSCIVVSLLTEPQVVHRGLGRILMALGE